MAVLTGSDGAPGWRMLRVLIVAALTVAAVTAERRLSPQWRGRIATLAGVPAVAVAAGFTPYLAKDGPLLIRLATVVLLACGTGLAAGGTVVATRGRRTYDGSPPAQA